MTLKKNDLVYIDESEPSHGGQMAIFKEYDSKMNVCNCTVVDDCLEMSFFIDPSFLVSTGLRVV